MLAQEARLKSVREDLKKEATRAYKSVDAQFALAVETEKSLTAALEGAKQEGVQEEGGGAAVVLAEVGDLGAVEVDVAAGDGLDPYRRLLSQSRERLTPGGMLVLQFRGVVYEATAPELDLLAGELGRLAA